MTVLEYLLFWGSDNVIRYTEDNLYEIKTLREFQYIDDNANDCGMNVRQKAKDSTNLIVNPNMLKSKRRKGRHPSPHDVDDLYNSRHSSPHASGRTRRSPDRDEDARRALAESKRLAEQKRKNSEEEDLQRALKPSKEEDERHTRTIEQSNASLFNDQEAKK